MTEQMRRFGPSGGMICLNSFLQTAENTGAREFSLRVASVSLREAAMKEGLQSLYVDPEKALESYKDFDIAAAMAKRKGQNILWVRARAIDADVTNANGDYFSEEELLKDFVDQQGKKTPAYKTFEGCPMYTNHENSDITKAKGEIVYAEWDDEEKCVYCTFYIDCDAYPDIANGIRKGYMHDVSMGCQVQSGTCSKCGNKAETEKDYCECLKKYKGKKDPASGKTIYEKNHGLKFIELSVVGDGAFHSCEIKEIYDVDDMLDAALSTQKRAESIMGSIMLAESVCPADRAARREWENCLRQVAATTRSCVTLASQAEGLRTAQVAGTLVGGQLMAGEGANNNTTVGNILKFLGIDAGSGLNVLDMLNLALNFLEVSVMNLFARKDNVDLTHVGEITKSMAALQKTMQDMIDDGVDTGGGAGGAPMNQAAQGQGAQPQGTPAPPGGNADYQQAGQVGRQMAPTQNQALPLGQGVLGHGGGALGLSGGHVGFPGIGGGVLAETKSGRPMVVWASDEAEEDHRAVFASTAKRPASDAQPGPSSKQISEQISEQISKQISHHDKNSTSRTGAKLQCLAESLDRFATTLGLTAPIAARRASDQSPVRTTSTQPFNNLSASAPTASKQNTPALSGAPQNALQGAKKSASHKATGESSMSGLNPFAQVAKKRQTREAAKLTVSYTLADDFGNRMAINTDGDVTASHKGQTLSWEPSLTEEQYGLLDSEQGGVQVLHSLLAQFRKDVRTAQTEGRDVIASWTPNHDTNTVLEEQLAAKRTGEPNPNQVREQQLKENKNRNDWQGEDNRVREETLEGKRTGNPSTVQEEQLDKDAGLYGWKGEDNRVQEALLEDARKGHPDKVQELQLEQVREDYNLGDADFVTTAAVDALGRAVVTSGVHPVEIVEAAAQLAARKDLSALIHLASLGTKVRQASVARRAFHNKGAFTVTASAAILHELGSAVTEKSPAAGLAEYVRVAAADASNTVTNITVVAKSLMGEGTEPASVRTNTSFADQLRARNAAKASQIDETTSIKELVKAGLSALAMASTEVGAHPGEVVEAIAGTDVSTLLAEVELARTSEAESARITRRARAEFYGSTRSASKKDVREAAIGWLADYSKEYKMPTAALVDGVKRALAQPTVAENLVSKMIKAKAARTAGTREAGFTVTDEKNTTKRLVCRVEELGGLDPKSDDFESGFREKAIQAMSGFGYQVDPQTFSLTSLSVTENGDVTAEVSSRVSKTFKVESMDAASSPDGATLGDGSGGVFADPNASQEQGPEMGDGAMGVGPGADTDSTPAEAAPMAPGAEEGDTLLTQAAVKARALRTAKRQSLLTRYAQAMPGGAGGAAPMGGDPMAGGGAAAGAADGLGMSALTVPTAAGGAEEPEPEDTDAMSEPGQAKPWGSICPRCGADDVDVANGEGSCKSCGANLKFTFDVQVLPDKDDGKDEDDTAPDDTAPEGPALGADTGLGAATAPQPSPGAPGGGAPPMGGVPAGPMASAKNKKVALAGSGIGIMRVSWDADPDDYIRTTVAGNSVTPTGSPQQPGTICVGCGNREADVVGDETFCYACGLYSRTAVAETLATGDDPTKVRVSTTWLIR